MLNVVYQERFSSNVIPQHLLRNKKLIDKKLGCNCLGYVVVFFIIN